MRLLHYLLHIFSFVFLTYAYFSGVQTNVLVLEDGSRCCPYVPICAYEL